MGKELGENHYHWFYVILGCCGCSAILITVLGNTAGLFLTPVMEEYQWTRTQASLYMTIFAWVAALIQPLVAKVYEKRNMRWVLTCIVIIYCASYMTSAHFTKLWQWNVFGIVYGICGGFFMYLPTPLLVNRWFAKRNALMMSLTGVVTGILGFFASPLIQKTITTDGWRTARFYTGFIILILCAGLTVLFVRNKPETMGMQPFFSDYEESESSKKGKSKLPSLNKSEGLTIKAALKTPSYYLMILFGFLTVLVPSLNQQLPSYSATVPIGAAAGAFALSILSIVNLPRGPLAGWFIDLAGGKIGNMTCWAITAVGLITIILSKGESPVAFYIGVVCFSFSFVPLTIGNPIIAKEAFGLREYEKIYSGITTAVLFSGGVSFLLYAQIFDHTGSYTPCLYLALGVSIIQIILIPIIVTSGKRAQEKFQQQQ